MNILIVGERYSNNLGDPLICEVVSRLINDEFGDIAKIVSYDLSGRIGYDSYYRFLRVKSVITIIKMIFRIPLLIKNRPSYESWIRTFVRHVRSLSLYEKILAESDVDLIIFAGGSLFMDFFANLIYYIVKEASCRKIPVIFHACGLSNLSKRSVRILKKAFSSKYVRSISIRDGEDFFKKSFGEKIKFEKTSDTVLCCSRFFTDNCQKEADIGVGVIDLPQYLEVQKAIVEKLNNSQLSWKLFSNGSHSDQIIAEEILRFLNIDRQDYSNYLCVRPTIPEELVKTISSFKKIISFRMHSQVIASSLDIDSYAVIWDDKIKGFYKSIGFPQRCFYPDEIVNALPLILREEKADSLFANVLLCADDSQKKLLNQISDILEE